MKPASITRQRKGKGFAYYRAGRPVKDQMTLDRIASLAIPPAWNNVVISSDPSAKVLAAGRDKAGRLQAIYNPDYREQRENEKYSRLVSFGRNLPKLRAQIDKDLRALRTFDKDTVIAAALLLIDATYFRIGNARYAQEHHVYGVTTLRSRHVSTTHYSATFDFTGKSGKHRTQTITDRRLTHIIKQLDETPGRELFRYRNGSRTFQTVTASEVNGYIKKYMRDDFTAKDFRTWGGTLTAIKFLSERTPPTNNKERRKIITDCVKHVARCLGNTPAVARSSYIDPQILTRYADGEDFTPIMHAAMSGRLVPYLSTEEQGALAVLTHVRRGGTQQSNAHTRESGTKSGDTAPAQR